MDHSEVKHLPKVDHTPAELDEPSKLLLKAADIIEEVGLWCGTLSGGGKCVLTALIEAEGGSSSLRRVGDAAFNRFMRAIAAKDTTAVYEWNDTSNQQNVVAKMRGVALGL